MIREICRWNLDPNNFNNQTKNLPLINNNTHLIEKEIINQDIKDKKSQKMKKLWLLNPKKVKNELTPILNKELIIARLYLPEYYF